MQFSIKTEKFFLSSRYLCYFCRNESKKEIIKIYAALSSASSPLKYKAKQRSLSTCLKCFIIKRKYLPKFFRAPQEHKDIARHRHGSKMVFNKAMIITRMLKRRICTDLFGDSLSPSFNRNDYNWSFIYCRFSASLQLKELKHRLGPRILKFFLISFSDVSVLQTKSAERREENLFLQRVIYISCFPRNSRAPLSPALLPHDDNPIVEIWEIFFFPRFLLLHIFMSR